MHLQNLLPALFLTLFPGLSSTPVSPTIHVISREDGSGTQSAFDQLAHIDQTDPHAEVSNSTAVVITSVAHDPGAIGYISLGSLSDQVKAEAIDGVKPSFETVKNGTYPLKRSFLVVFKDQNNPLIQDFMKYVHSRQSAQMIEQAGYVPEKDQGLFVSKEPTGTITIGGSSSVTPVMEKLAEEYEELNGNSEVDVLQSDSTVGISNVLDGTYDIGMSSRDLSDEEKVPGLHVDPICSDGIAVIVNKKNNLDNLSLKQIDEIYTGEVHDWKNLKD